MQGEIPTVAALAEINLDVFINGGKTRFQGVGLDSLKIFHERAKLLKSANGRYRRIILDFWTEV